MHSKARPDETALAQPPLKQPEILRRFYEKSREPVMLTTDLLALSSASRARSLSDPNPVPEGSRYRALTANQLCPPGDLSSERKGPRIRFPPSLVTDREPAGNTTNTDPRSQRIRASRRGGQIMCSNSQFICIRRPARTCVLPVPRGRDSPSLPNLATEQTLAPATTCRIMASSRASCMDGP